MTGSGPLVLVLGDEPGVARELGGRCVPEPSARDLDEAEVVVFLEPDWGRLRMWRLTGRVFIALVRTADPPESRALLEPLIVIPQLDAAALALARRTGAAQGTLRLANVQVDLRTGTLLGPGEAKSRLSTLEVDLLAYLAARSGRDVPREELQLQVWGHRKVVATRAVDMAVSRLRRKIEPDAEEPTVLLTRRGGGYRLALAAEAAPPARHTLPRPGRSLVGRDTLVADVLAELTGGARPLTLVGAPGSGKTRLALEVAWRVVDTRPAWFCELARADSIGAITRVVAAETGLDVAGTGGAGEEVIRRLGAALGARGPGLLVLDNAEHLVDEVAELLSTWTTAAPDLWFLVTSQVRLGTSEEQVREVAPLAEDDACALFAARAGAIGTAVDPRDPLVRGIVARLDGLPLAIELAAGRTRGLALEDLDRRLDHRLRVLEGGPRVGTARHATLRNALEWAWDLLSTAQQDALREVAVFEAAVPMDALEAVLTPNALATLDVLVERSLVQRLGPRYGLLPSIRAFVREATAPDAAAIKRHDDWATALAREVLPRFEGSAALAARDALAAVEPDLTAAWARAVDPLVTLDLSRALDAHYAALGSWEASARMAEATVTRTVGTPAHGAALIQRGLLRGLSDLTASDADLRAAAELPGTTPEARARALLGLSTNASRRGDFREALQHARAAVDLARACGDTLTGATATGLARAMEHATGDPGSTDETRAADIEAAVEVLVAADRLKDAVGALFRLVHVLHNAGDRRRCRRVRERAAELADRVANLQLRGQTRRQLALALWQDGEFSAAIAAFDQAQQMLLQTTPAAALRSAHPYRAMMLADAGRLDEAEAAFDDVRRDAIAADNPGVHAHALEGLASVAILQGRAARGLAYAEEGLRSVARASDHLLAADLELQRALALALLGRLDEADGVLREVDPRALHGTQAAMLWSRRLAVARARRDEDGIQAAFHAIDELLKGVDFSGAGALAHIRAIALGLAVPPTGAPLPAWARGALLLLDGEQPTRPSPAIRRRRLPAAHRWHRPAFGLVGE